MAATDFFTVELWTAKGLVRYQVRFVIRFATREVKLAGIVPEPNAAWMQQVARYLTDPWDGFLRSASVRLTISTVQRHTWRAQVTSVPA